MLLRLLPILGITFIDILGFSILIPLMPFFVKQFGAPDVTVGVTGVLGAFGVAPAAAIIIALVAGALVMGILQARRAALTVA